LCGFKPTQQTLFLQLNMRRAATSSLTISIDSTHDSWLYSLVQIGRSMTEVNLTLVFLLLLVVELDGILLVPHLVPSAMPVKNRDVHHSSTAPCIWYVVRSTWYLVPVPGTCTLLHLLRYCTLPYCACCAVLHCSVLSTEPVCDRFTVGVSYTRFCFCFVI
jgi:hypothetical protein